MKITAILLIAACLQVNAKGFSQNVSLEVKSTSLQKIFKIINQQTGYLFFYKNGLLEKAGKIDVNVRDVPLEEALAVCFKNLPITYLILDKTIIVKEKPLSNNETKNGINIVPPPVIITGIVVSADGKLLEGASVSLKNTNIGTSTDINGRFSIQTTESAGTLVISYVGHATQNISFTKASDLKIILIPVEQVVDEIVVTAYGKVKKQNLTDAVATIDGKALVDRPLRSLADGLVGLSAGLNIRTSSGAPEASPSLNIRGFTTINNIGSPLVLVDGIERLIQDVNPNDVESVSVLKDGASTAIYGSRAPYGVILITTKSGKAGKLQVNYSSNYKWGTSVMMPKKPVSYDWAQLINQVQMSNPAGTGVALYSDLTIQRMKAWIAGDFTNPVFAGIDMKYVIGGQFPDATSNYGYTNVGAYANDDYEGAYFRKAVPSNQHNISFSGGSDRMKYYVGFGYNETNGIINNFDNYNRKFNVLSKITFKATDWLDLDASMNYVRNNYQGANFRGQGINYSSVFSTYGREFFNVPIKNPDNTNYYTSIVSLGTVQGLGGLNNVSTNNMVFSGGFTIKPIKNLNIVGGYTFRNGSTQNATSQKVINQFNPNGTTSPGLRTANTSAEFKTFDGADYSFYKLSADYTKTIANNHHLFVQLGMQAEENQFSSLTASGQGLYAQSVVTSISTTAGTYAATDRLYEWSTLGYYGVMTYDYKEKYMLKLAARQDASSRFAPDSRWGFFPSVSAAWNVAKEKFWPLKDWVSDFKPRVSWSKSGDLASAGANNYYTYLPTLSFATSTQTLLGGNFASYADPAGLVSNSLTWAKPTVIDFGLDITALKNRLSFTFDWYQRTVYDQAGPPNPIAQTLGTAAPSTNNSVSETRGWEFKAGWNDKFQVSGKPFNYGLSVMMSDYVGYVVQYSANNTGARTGWTPGQVFGVNYVYKNNGTIQNKTDLNAWPVTGTYNYPGQFSYRDNNGDGYVNTGDGTAWYNMGDLVAEGYNYPRKSYSILPSVSWNNVTVSAVFEGVFEWKAFVDNEYVFGTTGTQFFSPFYQQNIDLGYWNTNNTGAFFPAVNQGRTANDKYILNLANLRIRNVTIGYDLPQRWIRKAKMQRVNIYASGENLGFIYLNSFVKYDPELLVGGGNGYPPMRNYSIGVNITL